MKHGNKLNGWLLQYDETIRMTKLKALRTAHRISTDDAAKMCGMSSSHYLLIENARKQVTDLTLPKLSAFLAKLGCDRGTTMSVLL